MARLAAPEPRDATATAVRAERHDHATIRRRRARLIVERILLYAMLRCPRDTFAVRGAWSFAVWLGEMPRATRGLDLAHLGSHRNPAELLRNACPRDGPEALLWNDDDVSEAGDGWTRRTRIRLRARIHGALEPFVVDVAHNVGVPEYVERRGMTLARGTRLSVTCLSREWLVAEKCALLVTYGEQHSRLQDFFDLLEVSEWFRFEGTALSDAFRAVASGRDAERMVARADGYWERAMDAHRNSATSRHRWEAIGSSAPGTRTVPGLLRAIADVQDFVCPMLESVRASRSRAATWQPRQGWIADFPERSGSHCQPQLPFGAERRGELPLAPRIRPPNLNRSEPRHPMRRPS